MPDAWETDHGLDVGEQDAGGDHDGAGWPNIEEYFADAASCV